MAVPAGGGPAEDLADLGYRTLGDALGGVLGLRADQDRAYTGLGVRGLYLLGDPNTRVLILLDTKKETTGACRHQMRVPAFHPCPEGPNHLEDPHG